MPAATLAVQLSTPSLVKVIPDVVNEESKANFLFTAVLHRVEHAPPTDAKSANVAIRLMVKVERTGLMRTVTDVDTVAALAPESVMGTVVCPTAGRLVLLGVKVAEVMPLTGPVIEPTVNWPEEVAMVICCVGLPPCA